MRKRAVLVLAFSVVAWGVATAQPSGQAVFRGRVTTNLGTEPLVDAEIVFREASRSARSGPDGRFIFSGLAAGEYNVIVRHPGFAPITGKVRLAAGDTITYPSPFDLVREKQELMPVEIRGRADFPQLRAFETRRATTNGRFLTAADIHKTGSVSLASIILTKIPGFQVVQHPSGSGSALASRRGGVPDASGRNSCYTAVWLNGQLFYSPEKSAVPVPHLEDFELEEIGALEFYRTSEVPPELQFQSGNCGVIVLWTQIRRRPER
jgi:hypothetical protein